MPFSIYKHIMYTFLEILFENKATIVTAA